MILWCSFSINKPKTYFAKINLIRARNRESSLIHLLQKKIIRIATMEGMKVRAGGEDA
jgi:hypothetical protein